MRFGLACIARLLMALLVAPARAETPDGEQLSEEEQAAKQSENPISRTVHLSVETAPATSLVPRTGRSTS